MLQSIFVTPNASIKYSSNRFTINKMFGQIFVFFTVFATVQLLRPYAVGNEVIRNISKRFLARLNNYIQQLYQLFLNIRRYSSFRRISTVTVCTPNCSASA